LSIGLVGFAHAADVLPTTKPAPAPPQNCFASVWAYIDSTAADCPLSWGPFTVYATLDAGLMYNTNGAPWSPAFVNGTQGLISKQSNGSKWLWSPNNINQSVIGIKVSQPIANGWSLVGTLEAGFDPISGYLSNSQRSQVMNNGKPLALQSANGDSSRRPMGQFAILPRLQQQDIRDADRRPRQLPRARWADRLRSHGQRLRLFAIRVHRHVCWV
jgi:hypothetical protein